jgi:RIO kinase 2
LFNRDVECLRLYFFRKYGFAAKDYPTLHKDVKREHSLDKDVAASGWTADHEQHFSTV